MCFGLFGRRNKSRGKVNKAVMPTWDEIVEFMYGKDLNYVDNIIDVIYSKDRSARCVLLKSDIGSYKILFEQLFAYDEEEWVMLGGKVDPGYWQPIYEGKSFFDSEQTARREMQADPYYKRYFDTNEE